MGLRNLQFVADIKYPLLAPISVGERDSGERILCNTIITKYHTLIHILYTYRKTALIFFIQLIPIKYFSFYRVHRVR